MATSLFSLKNFEKVECPEWIWIDGYKGTDKDMKCRGYQFELGKQADMPEDAKISLCESGFHFCTDLGSVFNHYTIGQGNRFFKVSALVRAKKNDNDSNIPYDFFGPFNSDKEVSKSIIFTKELTTDEILDAYGSVWARGFTNDLTDEEKVLVREIGISEIKTLRKVRTLESIGYVRELAEYITHNLSDKAYDLAIALSKQTDISMDARIIAVFSSTNERKRYIDEFITKDFNIPAFSKYGTIGVDTSKKN